MREGIYSVNLLSDWTKVSEGRKGEQEPRFKIQDPNNRKNKSNKKKRKGRSKFERPFALFIFF